MKKLLKNKMFLIVLGVVVFLAVVGGGYAFLKARNASTTEGDGFINDQVVEKMDASEIGLTMEANGSNKAVKFKIAKADGIESIEYQVTYEADSTAAEKSEGGEPRVQRGITGEAAITAGKSTYESEWLDLGSCSKNVCRYDTGVKEVVLTLKVTKDNKIYEVNKTLAL